MKKLASAILKVATVVALVSFLLFLGDALVSGVILGEGPGLVARISAGGGLLTLMLGAVSLAVYFIKDIDQ